jgi:hypothetical protein
MILLIPDFRLAGLVELGSLPVLQGVRILN